ISFDWLLRSQFSLQDLIDLGGIGLPLRRLHSLPNQKVERFLTARAVFRYLTGVRGQDAIDDLVQCARVRDLSQAAIRDNGVRLDSRVPHRVENVLGSATRNRVVLYAFQ